MLQSEANYWEYIDALEVIQRAHTPTPYLVDIGVDMENASSLCEADGDPYWELMLSSAKMNAVDRAREECIEIDRYLPTIERR
jgi:hypothetical protein